MSSEKESDLGITVADCLATVLVVYFIITVSQLTIGLADAVTHVSCEPPRRIEYFLPGYRIGRWLGERA